MGVTLGSVLGALGGLVAGGVAGGAFGRWARGRGRALFWVGAAVMLACGMALAYVGYVRAADWLSGFGVGVMGGGLTGVKYGVGLPRLWRGDDTGAG